MRARAILPVLLGSVAAAGQGPVRLPGWMAGCWEQSRQGRVTVEMWMAPAAGLMLGASRTVAGNAVREYEQMLLRVDNGRLVYTAHPSGQAEASFTSTEVTDSSLVVENLQHDFPQRVIYRRQGKDSLRARIEGPGPSGTQGMDFPMRRISCGG